MPVTVYCRKCLNGDENLKLCKEFGDAINTNSSCLYLYENIDSVQGSSFVPQLATVMDEICHHKGHPRPKVMEVSEDTMVSGSRDGVKKSIIKEIKRKRTVGEVATF